MQGGPDRIRKIDPSPNILLAQRAGYTWQSRAGPLAASVVSLQAKLPVQVREETLIHSGLELPELYAIHQCKWLHMGSIFASRHRNTSFVSLEAVTPG